MLSLWANWLVTKFGLKSLKRYLWPVLYTAYEEGLWCYLKKTSDVNVIYYSKLETEEEEKSYVLNM